MEKITTIISDIHLGSEVCQAKNLCRFLDGIEDRCDRLILNGDVFESMDFRRLKKHHWNVLSALRKISDKMEVVWVAGNHDGPAEIISHLIGVSVYDEYVFKSGNKNILALHGHIFDKFIVNHPILTFAGDVIYGILQRIDKSNYIARLAKHSSKTYLRCAEMIRVETKKIAAKMDCQIVCCGHTHHAVEDRGGDVEYYNSGCWTELPCHYLEISDGNVELHSSQIEYAALE